MSVPHCSVVETAENARSEPRERNNGTGEINISENCVRLFICCRLTE